MIFIYFYNYPDDIDGKANASHTHTIANITNLQTNLNTLTSGLYKVNVGGNPRNLQIYISHFNKVVTCNNNSTCTINIDISSYGFTWLLMAIAYVNNIGIEIAYSYNGSNKSNIALVLKNKSGSNLNNTTIYPTMLIFGVI